MPAVTIALGARLTVRSKAGERTIDAAELALGTVHDLALPKAS